ncbi:MAG TPA: 3-ketoacyl-ACP reductase [Alphaproteobacteria bacterium]|nr:3-ketoacyl-ACP reductase [Alphaproteobacteria bacterium]
MDIRLKGKRALVLGGTRGIGRAIVETLAGEGAAVGLCARTPAQVEEVVTALKHAGARAIGAAVDMGDHGALADWVAQAARDLGGIDILISNASALVIGNTKEAWQSCLNIDVLGAATAFEAAKPFLSEAAKAHDDAAAVFVSSVSAAETEAPQAYGAMKAALIHLAKGLAKENAKHKIRVNVVSPGTIYFKGGVWEMIEQNMPDRYKGALRRNPLGRMGSPQEIADMTVFLASPISSFTTGANVIVDGGITGRVNF